MVTLKVKHLKGFQKLSGLINTPIAYPVFFKTRFGIHTFGLQFPIDVLILDNQNKVVKISEGLRPNRILIWPLNYNQVLELPAETIEKNKLTVGNRVKLILL